MSKALNQLKAKGQLQVKTSGFSFEIRHKEFAGLDWYAIFNAPRNVKNHLKKRRYYLMSNDQIENWLNQLTPIYEA